MTSAGWIQLAAFCAAVLILTRPVGAWLHRVFEGAPPFPRTLGALERRCLRLAGVEGGREQTWREYARSLLLFSAASMLVTYALLRLQHLLPLDPLGLGPVRPDLAFATAASFVTNTDWQSYAGERTMSYLSQMAALAWQNFTSAAAGLGVGLALARGLTRRGGPDAPRTLGCFWVDLVRAVVHVFLPLSVLVALFLVSQGVVQTLAGPPTAITVEGARQTLAVGPVASQEAIKLLGTNGGGFMNANSAHPFENPSPLTGFVQLLLIFLVPAGLTHTYGRMAGHPRQGAALLGAMGALFLAGAVACWWAEARPNPALDGLGVDQSAGSLEGKETRFGVAGSALFATVTTDASCGATSASHASFTALGGLVPLANIHLGEVVFGGVGAGLYGILVMAVLTVFVAGLMVGRTPELLGKKIEPREMKLAVLYLLVFPLTILLFTAWAVSAPAGVAAIANPGPHGLTEVLYAYSSAAGNNGSGFAGIAADTPFWNVTLALAMLAGRFLMMVPALALAGALVGKRVVAPGPGTFPTDGPLFAGMLVAVVLVVGALTFLPALTLGPILEHVLGGRLF